MNITRSFARKKNCGNYETADFFASYSQDFDDDISMSQINEESLRLFTLAREDVEKAIADKDKKTMSAEVAEIIERTRNGGSITVDEYEKVVYAGFAIDLNDAKKEYKRSPAYKESVKNRVGKHQ